MPSEKRIYHRLIELARLFGRGAVDGPVVIPLTQEQLAQLAGTTRPTANRVLRAGEDRGIVRMTRGRVAGLDLDALQQHSR